MGKARSMKRPIMKALRKPLEEWLAKDLTGDPFEVPGLPDFDVRTIQQTIVRWLKEEMYEEPGWFAYRCENTVYLIHKNWFQGNKYKWLGDTHVKQHGTYSTKGDFVERWKENAERAKEDGVALDFNQVSTDNINILKRIANGQTKDYIDIVGHVWKVEEYLELCSKGKDPGYINVYLGNGKFAGKAWVDDSMMRDGMFNRNCHFNNVGHHTKR